MTPVAGSSWLARDTQWDQNEEAQAVHVQGVFRGPRKSHFEAFAFLVPSIACYGQFIWQPSC